MNNLWEAVLFAYYSCWESESICVLSGTSYSPCKLDTGSHKKLLHSPRKALPQYKTIGTGLVCLVMAGTLLGLFFILFYFCFGFLYTYLMQPTSRAYINDTSVTNIMAESVVMDVEGPHHATLFHDLCGSNQLHKLLPEPFLVTENDVGKFFSAPHGF